MFLVKRTVGDIRDGLHSPALSSSAFIHLALDIIVSSVSTMYCIN